jgi:glycosyltransferase involved in cell wall biosynthesis
MVGNGRSVHVTARSAAVAARGPEVRLVTLGAVMNAPGVDVRTRPIPRTMAAAIGAARGFLHDVRSFAPDLLHLHYAGGKLGTMALLSGIRPLVVTVMGGDVLPEQHLGGLSPLERRATRRVLSTADLVLVKSDGLRQAVATFGAMTGRMETVRWGVDPETFHRDETGAAALRERLGLDPQRRVLLSARGLAPLYNIQAIVEAMPAVRERVPAAMLVLTEYTASPSYREQIQRRVAALDLSTHVRFVGAVPHADMAALYSLAEVVVSVPASDGLPQSLFEAMACGAPMVLGRLPAYEEVVRDDETALLAELAPPAIAAAVVRLLSDAALRLRISAAARARVAEVAFLPREVDRVIALYSEVLKAPRGRTRGPLRDGRALDALSLFFR